MGEEDFLIIEAESIVEAYCSGDCSLDYAIDEIRALGFSRTRAKQLVKELKEKYEEDYED